MRTRQKRVATHTWRSLGCRTTPLGHRSRRKPTVEPRWAKQQTKKLKSDCKQPLRIGIIRALDECTGRLFRSTTWHNHKNSDMQSKKSICIHIPLRKLMPYSRFLFMWPRTCEQKESFQYRKLEERFEKRTWRNPLSTNSCSCKSHMYRCVSLIWYLRIFFISHYIPPGVFHLQLQGN